MQTNDSATSPPSGAETAQERRDAGTPCASIALVTELGFSGPILRIPPNRLHRWSLNRPARLFHCGQRLGVELLLSVTADGEPARFRRWVAALARRTPRRRFFHLEQALDGALYVAIARPPVHSERDVCVRQLSGTLIDEVKRIEAVGREHLTQRLADLLDRRQLTERFFRAFRKHLLHLEALWIGLRPSNTDAYARRDLTMALLCRLMFVTFVAQDRGLAGRRDYLRWLLEQPRRGDIYRGALRPFFFSGLNLPTGERPPEAALLGPVPFLNGGLFHPLAAEQRAADTLTLPDDPLAEAISELFEKYTFSAVTSGASGEVLLPRIDPEMLGHVFEALMHGDERKRSGSFYTPAALVRQLTAEALSTWAERLSKRAAHWVSGVLGEGDPDVLPEPMARKLDDRLSAITIVDPAVGSGAFLLGALDALTRVRSALDAGGELRASEYWLRRRIISTNLYGVDIKAGAVRLCELRLWLSLIASAPRDVALEPLPNLDHHVRQGDSLAAPFVPWTSARGSTDPGQACPAGSDLADLYGAEKAAASKQRRGLEIARLEGLVRTSLSAVETKISDLERPDHQSDLFGARSAPPARRGRERRVLFAQLADLEAAARSLLRGELPLFSYRAAFPGTAATGGFDLVLSNPPWVRPHGLSKTRRAFLKRRYRVCRGGRSGFNQQVDLAAAFVERGLELLKPGGLMAMLVPAKVFRAQYGRALRGLLTTQHSVRLVADLSLAGDRQFSASSYPGWLMVENRAPEVGLTARVGLQTKDGRLRTARVAATRLSDPGIPGDPWTTLPADAVSALAAMGAGGVTLRGYGLQPRLGLKTGRNRVFLSDIWRVDSNGDAILTMQDGTVLRVPLSMAPLAICGRDIRPFGCSPSRRLLLPYDRTTAVPLGQLSDGLATYFRRHQSALSERSDSSDRRPSWALFRTAAMVPGHKVIWRDIAPCLQAVFCERGHGALPLNTTYFCEVADPAEGRLVAALLNSTWVRVLTVATAEPAMSGYFRLNAWAFGRVPWPARLRPSSREARHLIAMSEAGEHEWAPDQQRQLDDLTAWLYGLTGVELKTLNALRAHYPGVFP